MCVSVTINQLIRQRLTRRVKTLVYLVRSVIWSRVKVVLTCTLVGEWLPETRDEFAKLVKGNAEIKDPILRALMDIEQALEKAWLNNRCLTCPIGELTALAAATRTFYQISKNAKDVGRK